MMAEIRAIIKFPLLMGFPPKRPKLLKTLRAPPREYWRRVKGGIDFAHSWLFIFSGIFDIVFPKSDIQIQIHVKWIPL